MNNIYDLARVQLLTSDFDWRTIDARLVAWSSPPDFSPGDETVGGLAGRGNVVVGYSDEITSQQVSPDGTAQTNRVLIPNSVVGPPVRWFTMVKHAPVQDDAQLILYVDEAAGLPFDHRGLDIVVQPDWLQERGWWRP